MNESKGNAFAPIVGGLLTFLLFGIIVFFSVEQIFSGSTAAPLNVEVFGSIPLVQLFFATGMFTSLTLGVIVFLVLRTKFALKLIVEAKTEELIKSRDFFLRLFDESPVPYAMVEHNATILLPNKAAERLFGRTAEELRKYKFHELHDETYNDDSKLIYEKFTRGVAVKDVELEIVRSDFKKRWVRVSALPFRDYFIKNKGGVVSFVDITEQKAVDKAKTEFVSLASHQLRTPLSAMKWYGEMVLSETSGELSEKQRKYVEKIYRGNERMIELVNLLLSASRLELGSLTIDITNVDPVQMSRDQLEELAAKIVEKNLHIVENYSGDSKSFYTDKKLFGMIIQNLLSNAVKYTNTDGEVDLNIQISNEKMKLEVKDNGLGIPEEQHNKVFSKMFRADNARLKVTDGTGLGLYIVKQAVEALSGEIGFTSKQNEGTMFTVVIPNGTVKSLHQNK
jgi:PAS domain S-box-containing protein